MDNQIVVITGATSGLGRETARELARRGATVVILGRDAEKGAATIADLKPSARHPGRLQFLSCDLARLGDVRSVAKTLHDRFDRIDVLIANAGVINTRRRETIDGYEETFAVNHLAHFLLVGLMLDLLLKAPQGRIVVVSSDAHRIGRLNRDDPQRRRGYRGFGAYAASKLANLLFTFELARRLEHTPITVNALHPGAVASSFSTNNGPLARLAMRLLKPFFLNPSKAADTSVYLAADPRLATVTGRYFYRSRQHQTSRSAHDRVASDWLWRASETLTSFTYPNI